ncbi:MAG: alpha-2-macroglobulin family protein [Candidatus Acidiferrales bacterium]
MRNDIRFPARKRTNARAFRGQLRRSLLFLSLLALVVIVPPVGKGADAYFSLTTTRTFLPGEQVSLRLYADNVSALEFRVYKVKDPIAFFERLDDVHSFGHVSPKERVESPTLIERFHDWKRDTWDSIRDFFRMQYSARSRAQIRERQAAAHKSNVGTAAGFAQVPLLNSSQLVARWRQDLPSHFISETQQVPVNDLARGVYLVEATDGDLRAYTILIVSEMGIVTKTAPGQILTFAADRRTGQPVAQTEVRVWSDKKETAHLTSDANGLASAPLPQGQYTDVRVIGVHGDDVAVLSPETYNLIGNPGDDWVGYIYTDRPVYRPGDTAHYKVIVRQRSGEALAVPAGREVQLQIQDPDGKVVQQTKVALSAMGTAQGDFPVPANAALGYYSLNETIDGLQQSGTSGGFYVEEYKKPEYAVTVTPSQPRVLQGNSADATIEAKYYFGEPVAGASVKYVVHTSQYWAPFLESEEEDEGSMPQGDDSAGDDQYYAGEQVSEQSGTLDANGKLVVHIPTQVDEHHHDVRYRIEARVTDAANREISGANSVIATYGSFAVSISAQSYVYKKGDTIQASAIAKDYDGNPIHTAVHVELLHWVYTYGGTNWTGQPIASSDAQTGADGTVNVSFTAPDSGDYLLRVSAQTPEGRTVTGQDYVWITGPGEFDWGGGSRQIRIVADKKSYRVGDTAHVLVMTGVPDSYVLVTTERRTIQTQRVVHATSDTVTVDVPITSDDQPNVYLSAAFLHNDQVYQASKDLKAPSVDQQLKIEIQPAKAQFEPGEKASYTISAHDAGGRPVAGEFTIGIVDEAIYAIHPDGSGDIFTNFYGEVYDRVGLDTSLQFYFSGEAGKKAMILTRNGGGLSSRRDLAQLKPANLVQPQIRKNFPDTALWLAAVRTDDTGRAQATLEFPDSLTTWRATVRGVTSDTKVGSAINRVIVRKNLLVRLAVPRFFRQGDEVTVSAIVQNYLPDAKTARVSLDLKGLDVLDGTTRDVNVPSNGQAKLDWRVRAQSVAQADLLVKALTNQESDAMEITLPVIPFGVKRPVAASGTISAQDQQQTASVDLPGDPAQAAQSLDISLNSSIAGSLFSALDYLTSYPYGCTEQTMSSFLPDIIVAKAMKDLHLQSTIDTPDLEQKIQAGLDRLKDYQHDDGGWGWWKDDESQVFMTAYVVSGYGQARAAGVTVDSDSLAHGVTYLSSALGRYPDMRPDLRAFVNYALALNGSSKPDWLDQAWDARNSMNTKGLAMLGLALETAGDAARAKQIATQLESAAKVTDQEATWPATYDYFMEFEWDDSADTTAYAVQLLSHQDPSSLLLPKAAFWLVNHRDGGFYWDSTEETAMVIFGLTEYVKATHELGANFKAEVFVNGKQVFSRQFTSADAFNPVQPSIHLSTADLQPGANEIRVHKAGAGRLYWSANGSYYSADKRFVQSNKLSLNITRDYFRMTPQSVNGKIVYHLDPLSGDLHVGDLVAARVTIGGGEWRYLLVEDPIPAGAEFVQRDDLYALDQRPPWWQSWFERREFHDDRAAFFETYFNGTRVYTYLLKIVNPGKFRVTPAMVTPMYQSGISATTDAATVEVLP